MSIVAGNKNFDIYLTGNPPTQLRFRILNADASFKIRASMYYFTSMRIDLYKNDQYIAPSNALYVNGQMTVQNPGNNVNKYMPTSSNSSGTNYFSKTDQKIYFTIAGGDYIDLKISEVLFVKFGVPAITADAFFNEDTLIQNFADLLGIDKSKVKIASIVRATSRRRRSASESSFITFQISDDPITILTNSTGFTATSTSLQQLTATITNQYMTGELQDKAKAKLGVDLSSFGVQIPTTTASNTTIQTVNKINSLQLVTQASGCRAQSPCDVQPLLKVLDQDVLNFSKIKK